MRYTETISITLVLALSMAGSTVRSLAATPVPSFTIAGDVSAPGTWTDTRIKNELKIDLQSVHYILKGQSHTANCVPLLSVIEASTPSISSHIKHHELQFIVSVQGFDGYTVCFSMAELLPTTGNRKIWIAMDEDGKPLVSEGGLDNIVVPNDVKPARWVHGIKAITVIDGAKLPSVKP